MSQRTTNWLLAMLSIVLSLGAAEVALRLFVPVGSLYSNQRFAPALNERKNAFDYLARQQNDATNDFGFDEQLGWDINIDAGRTRTAGAITRRVDVIALGDSFTYGNEVAASEAFPAQLADLEPGRVALNMGVPGYGIGQMVRKHLLHGAKHEAKFVVFGIYAGDYERTSVGFTFYAKPQAVIEADQLRWRGVPVPAPSATLATLLREADEVWRLPTLAKNSVTRLSSNPEAYFASTDRVVRALFQSVRATSPASQKFVILLIPKGDSLVEDTPYLDRVHAHLLAVFNKMNVTVIDLRDAFTRSSDSSRALQQFYNVSDTGRVGHLSIAGHRLAAQLIDEELRR